MREVVLPHDHEFTEICVILKGTATHQTDEGEDWVLPGHVIVVPTGKVHGFRNQQDFEAINIYYLSAWFLAEVKLDGAGDGLLPVFFPEGLSQRSEWKRVQEFEVSAATVGKIRAELEDLDKADAEKPDRWTSCCFFKALLLMIQSYRPDAAVELPGEFSSVVWRTFAEIDRVVASGERLDLAAIARLLGLTRDHLGRLFRAQVGETPMAFFQRRRLHFVSRVLLNSDLALAEVALRYGYSDEAHMCRVFREGMRMTPREFRRKFASHDGNAMY